MTPTRRAALLGAAALCAGARPADAQDQAGLDARFAGGATGTGWLAVEAGNSLTLSGRLQGRPVRVLLDSGAGLSIVDLGLARRLGLRPQGGQGRDGDVQGVRDTASLLTAGINLAPVSLDLGALTLSGLQAVAIDLGGLARVGQTAPVVLGRQAFEGLMVEIDGPGRRVAFHAPGARSPPPGAAALPLRPGEKDSRMLSIAVEGGVAVDAQFDLGSQSALLTSQAIASARGWSAHRRVSTWISAGVAGIAPETITTLKAVTLAGAALPPTPLEMLTGWETPTIPLVVGLPVLSRFHLLTDYAHDRLYATPGAGAGATPFARNRSGLACRPHDDELLVLHVARGSPAEAQGWGPGDLIARVDAAPAATRAGFGDGAAGIVVRLADRTGVARNLRLADYF